MDGLALARASLSVAPVRMLQASKRLVPVVAGTLAWNQRWIVEPTPTENARAPTVVQEFTPCR